MTLEIQNFGLGNPYVLLLVPVLTIAIYLYIKREGMNRRKWLFLLSRFFIILLITTALADPYLIDVRREFKDITSIVILSDKSESMSIYKNSQNLVDALYKDLKERIGNITASESVSLRYFSEGDRTEIGNALYQYILQAEKDNNLIILMSDGNNNYGRDALDTARILADTGMTVFSLTPENPMGDIYISEISGGRKFPANAEYSVTVNVGKTNEGEARYNLNLYVDDVLVKTKSLVQKDPLRSFTFTYKFSERGAHKITAEIFPKGDDYFKANNKMMKTVDIVDKPRVWLISDNLEPSPLATVLNENYDVIRGTDFDQNFYNHDVIILDNINAERLTNSVVNSLNRYVVDGNGLIVIGGDNSYEQGNYHNSAIERILPVISTKVPPRERKEIAVVFLIDISQSTEYGTEEGSKINVEKALAINMLRQLNKEDYVGVIAFNVDAFKLSDMDTMEKNQYEVENKILSLQFGGGTDMLSALLEAEKMLGDFSCKKYVVILSDGVLGRRGRMDPTLEQVRVMRERGIITYTVGVGFDTDERFMSLLAEAGDGLYFKPEAYERLKIEFGQEGTDRVKPQYQLEIRNRHHFITRDLKLENTYVSKFNGVSEKSIAQVLITTDTKKPILTVWRFGVGRVASLTTDNGNNWAPRVYGADSGRLISAVTNWAIGDLEKRKAVRIRTYDTFVGRDAQVVIKSNDLPTLISFDSSGEKREISLKQIDVDQYSGTFSPKAEGFYPLKAVSPSGEDTDAIAVNYPQEYSRLGINRQELAGIVRQTDGKMYTESQMEQLENDAIEFVKKGSLKRIRDKIPLYLYFAVIALLIFFVDVMIRRIKEIIRLGRNDLGS